MSVWKLAQSNLAGRRARFLIGVCGQCSTISNDLPDPNNLVPRGQYNGYYVKALLLQKQAQFDTVAHTCAPSPKQSARDWIRVPGEIGWAWPVRHPARLATSTEHRC